MKFEPAVLPALHSFMYIVDNFILVPLFHPSRDPNRRPGLPSLGEWPLYRPYEKEYLELNEKFLNIQDMTRAIGRGPRVHHCAFWNDYLPQLVAGTGELGYQEVHAP